jgi:hypothetical protein
MAMFGGGIHSGETLQQVVNKAAAICPKFGISRIHVLGGGEPIQTHQLPVTVQQYDRLPASEVSEILSSCRMAYTAYSPAHLAKSSLVAALAAHGLPIVTQGTAPCLPDGLRHDVNVINEGNLTEPIEGPDGYLMRIGRAVRAWYEPHSIGETALSYSLALRSVA